MQGEVLGEHRLADAVGPDEDDVGGVAQEVERKELLDQALVDLGRVLPVEFGERLGRGQLGVAEPPLVVPALALGLLELDQPREPRLVGDRVPVDEHAVQSKREGAATERIIGGRLHRGPCLGGSNGRSP